MRTFWFTLPILLVTLGLPSVVQAQFDDNDESLQNSRWSLHAGAGWLSGDAKETSTWIIGGEYETAVGGLDAGSFDSVTLSVDYYPIEAKSGDTKSIVPMLVGYRRYGQISGHKVYFGLGVGGRYSNGNIPELRITRGIRFGWDLNAGVYVTPRIYLQARYLAGTHPKDDAMVTAELGMTF